MKDRYEDILRLPHHTSAVRPRMSMEERAAQFSAFEALNGHEEAISETARFVDTKPELSEEMRAELDGKQAILNSHIESQPEVTVSYYVLDAHKAGGACMTVHDRLYRVDTHGHFLVLVRGDKIPMEDILNLDSPLFRRTATAE